MTNNNTQNTQHIPYSNIARSILEEQKSRSTPQRIFFQVEQIVSQPNTLTTAYGYNIQTKEYIAIRLNTVEEYAEDLVVQKKLSKASAEKQAKSAYTGTHSREPLAAKRDKHRARFLTFDNCLLIGDIQGIPLYRSHWCEMISNQPDCQIFEGLAYLHVREAVKDQFNQVIKREIAHLNIIQQIKDLQLKDFDNNNKALNAALATQFRNGMQRTGYAIFQLFDTVKQQVIAEPMIFQKLEKISQLDPNSGAEYNVTTPLPPTESINAFMNDLHQGEVTSFSIERDILRVIMPLFFEVQLNKEAFCQQDEGYLTLLKNIYKQVQSGEIVVRLTCIHQVYMGAERKGYLIKNIQKGLIKAYSKVVEIPSHADGMPSQTVIRRYIPTVFALHFHRDSGNPYIAYNIFSHLESPIPPSPLYKIPTNMFGIAYKPLI